MHLAESLSLASSSYLTKERLYEKYVPIGAEKFISFHNAFYNHYKEVINLIKPILDEKNIQIIQLGGKNYDGIMSIASIKDYCHSAYVIRNSLLHFGEYSILFDICNTVGTKSVILNSIADESFICPFFKNPNQVVINSLQENSLPTYDPKASSSLLNKIKPEVIAQNILSQLGIQFSKPYETLYVGDFYKENEFELNIYPIRNYEYNLEEINSPIIRMDYCYDLDFLEKHLSKKSCRIRTDREIPENILQKYKSKILGIDLEIKSLKNFSSFIKNIKKNKIDILLFSFLNEEESNDIKMMYIDIEGINFQNLVAKVPDFDFLADDIYFKCNELLVYKDKFFISKNDILNGRAYDPQKFNKSNFFDLKDSLENCFFVKNLT